MRCTAARHYFINISEPVPFIFKVKDNLKYHMLAWRNFQLHRKNYTIRRNFWNEQRKAQFTYPSTVESILYLKDETSTQKKIMIKNSKDNVPAMMTWVMLG